MGLNELPDFMSYQLVHRLASALMEARKCFAPYAMMIVHSFNKEKEHFTDYQAFLRLFGKVVVHSRLIHVGQREGIQIYSEWVVGTD